LLCVAAVVIELKHGVKAVYIGSPQQHTDMTCQTNNSVHVSTNACCSIACL